eukprot:IDg13716t1
MFPMQRIMQVGKHLPMRRPISLFEGQERHAFLVSISRTHVAAAMQTSYLSALPFFVHMFQYISSAGHDLHAGAASDAAFTITPDVVDMHSASAHSSSANRRTIVCGMKAERRNAGRDGGVLVTKRAVFCGAGSEASCVLCTDKLLLSQQGKLTIACALINLRAKEEPDAGRLFRSAQYTASAATFRALAPAMGRAQLQAAQRTAFAVCAETRWDRDNAHLSRLHRGLSSAAEENFARCSNADLHFPFAFLPSVHLLMECKSQPFAKYRRN